MRDRLLPDQYPRLRNSAICLSILSMLVYFCASEGVAGFVGYLGELTARLFHHFG